MKIYNCFVCSRFHSDTFSCPAFPDGIPQQKIQESDLDCRKKECARGIYYEEPIVIHIDYNGIQSEEVTKEIIKKCVRVLKCKLKYQNLNDIETELTKKRIELLENISFD